MWNNIKSLTENSNDSTEEKKQDDKNDDAKVCTLATVM